MKTQIPEKRKIAICRRCDGEGFLIQIPHLKRIDCPRCNGTGRVYYVVSRYGEVEIFPYEEILPEHVSK